MNGKIPRVVLCFLIGIIAVATFQLTATPNGAPYPSSVILRNQEIRIQRNHPSGNYG